MTHYPYLTPEQRRLNEQRGEFGARQDAPVFASTRGTFHGQTNSVREMPEDELHPLKMIKTILEVVLILALFVVVIWWACWGPR